jgi:hypothetical protein
MTAMFDVNFSLYPAVQDAVIELLATPEFFKLVTPELFKSIHLLMLRHFSLDVNVGFKLTVLPLQPVSCPELQSFSACFSR